MKNLESLETVTHTHNTFYKNKEVSNTLNSEAVLGVIKINSSILNNKYMLKMKITLLSFCVL